MTLSLEQLIEDTASENKTKPKAVFDCQFLNLWLFFVNLNVLAETISQLLRTSEKTGENTVTSLELYQMRMTFDQHHF